MTGRRTSPVEPNEQPRAHLRAVRSTIPKVSPLVNLTFSAGSGRTDVGVGSS